jgi:hypothetical protein
MIPPDRKITVEKSTPAVAVAIRSSPMRVNRKAMTTVAKTSKNPLHPQVHPAFRTPLCIIE